MSFLADSLVMQLPNSNVDLTVCATGLPETDSRRFFDVFFSVWNKIHAEDRNAIEVLWNKETSPTPYPMISLQVAWFGDQDALATTGSRGMKIEFDWKTCSLFPAHVLQVPIAHEMGHVYQAAIGKNRFNMTQSDLLGFIELLPLPLKENALVEIHADEMVERWGFAHALKDAYLYQHFDLKGGDFVPRKKPRNEKRAYNEAKSRLALSRYDMAGHRAE